MSRASVIWSQRVPKPQIQFYTKRLLRVFQLPSARHQGLILWVFSCKDEQGAKPRGNKGEGQRLFAHSTHYCPPSDKPRPCGATIPDWPENKTKSSYETMRQTPELLEFRLSQVCTCPIKSDDGELVVIPMRRWLLVSSCSMGCGYCTFIVLQQDFTH